MDSSTSRLYRALHAVTADNESVCIREGLPHSAYTSPDRLATEEERIFQRSWVCLGHLADIPELGDYTVEAILDREVLIARGSDGIVRAFHNVCRHRGHAVAENCGNARRFMCPYHAWTYSLDGSLFHAPYSDDVAGLDKESFGLRPVKLETVAGALFVNLDSDAAPFDDCYPGLRAEIEAWSPDPLEMNKVFESPALHRANWKASVENFSECYHCGPVHKYLTDNIIDPTSYEVSAAGLVQRHVVGGRESGMTQRLWHVWPNTAMGLYPIPDVGLVWCVRHMYPRSVAETTYHYRWYATGAQSPKSIREYASYHAATTGAEDAAIVEGAQRGMTSGSGSTNVLICNPARGVGSEHAIAYFHDLLRVAMDTE